MKKGIRTALISAGVCLAGASVCGAGQAKEFSGAYSSDWLDSGNWGGAYPTTEEYAVLNKTASLAGVVPNNILSLRIGTAGGVGVLNVGPGAVFDALVSSSWDSQIGTDRDGHGKKGGNGTLNITGGTVTLNYLEVGRGNMSQGLVNLTDGELIIARGKGGYSMYLGTDDTLGASGGHGMLQVSGGKMQTRTGVLIGRPDGVGTGTFAVLGSKASQIGIGSNNSGDGAFILNRGSVLQARIDDGGITKVFVDNVDGAPQVVFEKGSVLDVAFSGVPKGGTWVVLELEKGDIKDNGLQFSSQVDTRRWSYKVDNSGENGVLTVTAVAAPLGLING